MLNVSYNGRTGEIIAEYECDSISYVTILFEDVETNWIPKSEITLL